MSCDVLSFQNLPREMNVKYRVTQKKRQLLKNPTKIEEIQGKKIIDRD